MHFVGKIFASLTIAITISNNNTVYIDDTVIYTVKNESRENYFTLRA